MPSAQKDTTPDVANDDYEQKFNTTSNRLNKLESAGDKDDQSNPDNLKAQEEHGEDKRWKTSTSNKADEKKRKERRKQRGPLGRLRHNSAYLFVVGLILLGVWFSSIFAPNILLVNMKEMFTNDLADATIALYTYDKKMLGNRLGKADCNNKKSIKCKLSTMSRQEVKAYEKAGFTVEGDKVEEDNLDDNDPSNDKPESRYKVTSIEFPHDGGTATDADAFEKNTNKSSAMKALVYSVFHPKSSFFMDERYKQRIKWRYDLTKNPTVYGTTEEKVNESFDKSMQGSDEAIDKTGGGAFSLKTLGGKGKDGLKEASKTVGELANSYVQLQCAYYTQGKITSNAAKKAKEITVGRFAMQYLKAADQIKAGLADEITANTLSGKLAWSSDGGFDGRNATDAVMYRHILFNESAGDSENGMKYYLDAFDSIGTLFPTWLQIMLTAKAVKSIAGVPGDLTQPPADLGGTAREYCLEGQKTDNKSKLKPDKCPALTIAGTPPPMIPAVAPIAAGSDTICPPPPKGIYLMYPASTTNATQKVVMPYVAGIFSEAVGGWANQIASDFTARTRGVAASDAFFAGTGSILGDMAMSRGMKPGTVSSMTQYLAQGTDIKNDLEEVARYNASQRPFDITNQYSFMGTIARSFGTTFDRDSPVLSSAFGVLSLIPNSINQLTSKASAFYHIQPLEFDSSRLRCPDAEYIAIGINADVACNVRYSMSKDELDAKVSDVLDYMTKSHPDETKDNIKELQERQGKTDFERDAADVARQVSEAQEGSDAKMIDEETGKPMKHSEYEKFMAYCVNREDPWGRSAMAVRREGLDEDEKEERRKTKDQNGNPISTNDNGDPNELVIKSAYMSITEGGKGDQEWYTGKKCLEDSEMLRNFRAYTMMCSVDASHSGALDCTEKDRAQYYFDGFYNNNDILFTSWW